MAESHRPFPYSQNVLADLAHCLSGPRFGPYLNLGQQDQTAAVEHYLYNARQSKALLYPLHICEVVLRNAVSDVLKADFHGAWHRHPDFLAELVPKTRDALNEGIKKAKTSAVDDVVAALSFGFWYHLLRLNHWPLWKTRFHRVVRAQPNTPYADMHARLARIAEIRNRIAHHEVLRQRPVATTPLAVYQDILEVIGFISADAASWVASHNTIKRVQRTKPDAQGVAGPLTKELIDQRFQRVTATTSLAEVRQRRWKAALVEDGDAVIGVVTDVEMGEYVLAHADDDLFLLSDHTLGAVVASVERSRQFFFVDQRSPIAHLAHLFGSDRQYAIVHAGDGVPEGFIQRAHRRY